jgi:putative NADH-flavin reductase
VVEGARAQGWAVTAFVRNPAKAPEVLHAKVAVFKGDLRDAASISTAVRTCRPHAIIDAWFAGACIYQSSFLFIVETKMER